MSKDIAAIHFKQPDSDPNIWGNQDFFRALKQRDIKPVFVGGIEAYSPDFTEVKAKELGLVNGILKTGKLDSIQLGDEGVQAIRARVGLSSAIEAVVPEVVNDLSLRSYGDKWKQYQLCSEFMPQTILLESNAELSQDSLEDFRSDKVVVKRVSGGAGHWVSITNKNQVQNAVDDMRRRISQRKSEGKATKGDLIIQEFMPSAPINDIVPINSVEKTKIIDHPKAQHELRYFCYVDGSNPEDMETSAVLRLIENSTNFDEWVYVDQESLPKGASLLASIVARRLIHSAGSKGGLMAIDLFKTEGHDNTSKWMVREVNVRDPEMVDSTDNPSLAFTQRQLLANLIGKLIDNKQLSSNN